MEEKQFSRPKGTRDFLYEEAAVRRIVMDRLRRTFLRFGFGDFDTPSFERLELLQCKSGSEVEEQIYRFDDKGGRKLGLIFEFTASLGRIAATNKDILRPFKRYQIGKVWRYESPQSNRYREFYQADVDIIGPYTMDAEVEILSLVATVLKDFGLEQFQFLFNHRKLLKAQLQVIGLTDEIAQSVVLRGLDKLDKIGPDGVRQYVLAAGVSEPMFDRFLQAIPASGDNEAILSQWTRDLSEIETGQQALADVQQVFALAGQIGLADHIQLTPFLVRGLDYYTGPIFEVRSPALENVSFGGGGRYDDLVGLFGGQAAGAVGFAFGIERLITVLTQAGLVSARKCEAIVMLALRNESLTAAAFQLANELRTAGVSVHQYLGPAKLAKQFTFASRMGFPFVLVVAEDELESGVFKLRNMENGQEEFIARADLPTRLLNA